MAVCSDGLQSRRRAGLLLSFYVGGAAARRLEASSDTDVGREALVVLRRAFGQAVPPPSHVHVTRWLSDRWARGSYSYVGVGGDAAATLALAAPLSDGALRFAGEATCQRMYATVSFATLHSQWSARAHSCAQQLCTPCNLIAAISPRVFTHGEHLPTSRCHLPQVHGAYVSAMREVAALVASRGRGWARMREARRRWPMLEMANMCEEVCTECPSEQEESE